MSIDESGAVVSVEDQLRERLFHMSSDEYHNGERLKSFMSSTGTKDAVDAAAKWAAEHDPRGPWKAFQVQTTFDKDSALYGDLVHERCLLGNKLWVGTDKERRSYKNGIHYLTRRKGKVNQRDILGCCYSVRQGLRYLSRKYPDHMWLTERVALGEFSVGSGEDKFDFDVKCKFDLLLLYYDERGKLCAILVDLKTTRDPTYFGFLRQARDLKYAFSLEWYSRILEQNGIEVTECWWLAAGKNAPWQWDVYECDQEMLGMAGQEIEMALLNIGLGQKYGWPSMKITEE